MKSARRARFTRGRGPGECHPRGLSAKIAQNSLFAISRSIGEPADIFAGSQVRAWEERLTQATPRESIGCPELAPAHYGFSNLGALASVRVCSAQIL